MRIILEKLNFVRYIMCLICPQLTIVLLSSQFLKQKVNNMIYSGMTQLKPFDKIQHSINRTTSMNEPLLRKRVPAQMKRQQNLNKNKLLYSLRDLSCGYSNKYTQINYKKSIFEKFGIVSPELTYVLIWNLFIQLCIVYVFLMIPIVIFFGQDAFDFDTYVKTEGGFVINIILCVIFSFDMLLRFNMGYYDNQRLVMSRKQISFNYLKAQFWTDIISTIILVIYVAGRVYVLAYVKVIFYVKVYSLYKINQTVTKVVQGSRIKIVLYMFIRLILITWFLNTWSACLFFAIDYSSYKSQDYYFQTESLWLTNSELVYSLDLVTAYPHWYIWYEYAFYWSIQTGATTGYGSITGKNPRQITFSNFVMFFMTVYFAYFINSVWQIINNIQESDEYNQKWFDLKLYISQLPLNYEEKRKINNYMIEVFKDDQKRDIQQFIVNNVPDQIKDQFYMSTRQKFYLEENYFSFIFKIPNYTENFTKLSYLLEEARYSDQQLIYSQGQLDPYLYYIQSGFVRLQIQLSPSRLYLYGKIINGAHFGSEQFFLRIPRKHNAIAATFVRVWRLDYEKMREVFKQNRQNNAIFFQLEENIRIFKIEDQLSSKSCFKCLRNDHSFYHCKQINFQGEKYIKAKEDKQEQAKVDRRSYKRSQNKQKIMRKIFKIINVEQRSHNVDNVKNYTNYRKTHNISYNKKFLKSM